MATSRQWKQQWALRLVGAVLALWAVVPAAFADGKRNRFTDPPSPVCTTSPSQEANVLTDCEFAPLTSGTVYANNTAIAVNPTRPANMVAVADDYQILRGGGKETHYALSRVRTTTDAGRSWATYAVRWGTSNVPRGRQPHRALAFHVDPPDPVVSDSAVAFDQTGTAYVSAISKPSGNGSAIYAAHSRDGGRRWSDPVRVAEGHGTQTEGIKNDRDSLVAWGDGNAMVAWAQYRLHGGYQGSPIMASVTHDRGRTWSQPMPISGSAPFCVGVSGDRACDQAQDAKAVVTADSHLMVSFVASDKAGVVGTVDPNKLMVVELDPSSGAPMGGPFLIAQLSDAPSQYPVNREGLPTLHDSQFVVSSLGGIAADPTNPAHLAATWSDMRNSPAPAQEDPYAAVTNSDILASQSYDRGRSWSAPVAIELPGDQFEPSTTYDDVGRLRISYFDRSYDPANNRYGYSVATERASGSLQFDLRQATTTLSDPTRDDHLQATKTVNPGFPHPTLTIGDHGAIAATPSGVIAYWTDLRAIVCFGDRCGAGQNGYIAQLP